jgi:hypothetical protein
MLTVGSRSARTRFRVRLLSSQRDLRLGPCLLVADESSPVGVEPVNLGIPFCGRSRRVDPDFDVADGLFTLVGTGETPPHAADLAAFQVGARASRKSRRDRLLPT